MRIHAFNAIIAAFCAPDSLAQALKKRDERGPV
jgi:hypothetical protein